VVVVEDPAAAEARGPRAVELGGVGGLRVGEAGERVEAGAAALEVDQEVVAVGVADADAGGLAAATAGVFREIDP
jgi:hypothetical protein